MSGKELVTLGNISYSRFQDTRLGPYAYGFAFDNRIIGYIKIPGMMELKPREGMPPLTCPYECTGDFEGGLHACSCKSQPICNSLAGHTALERLLYDAIIDAIADYIRNNQAAAYINDEKNAREPRNLSIPIPVIPLIPWRHYRDLTSGIRANRAFHQCYLFQEKNGSITKGPPRIHCK